MYECIFKNSVIYMNVIFVSTIENPISIILVKIYYVETIFICIINKNL